MASAGAVETAQGYATADDEGVAAWGSAVRDGLLEEPASASVDVLVRLKGEPRASVILEFRARFGEQAKWPPSAVESARAALEERDAALAQERAEVLGRLRAAGFDVTATRDYRYLADGLNLRDLPAGALPLLGGDPHVLLVERDHVMHVDLNQSVPVVNGDDVWNLTDIAGRNITGEGALIANIDTGVDYTHPDLGGTLNRTSDFAAFLNGTHTKFAGGWDFVNNDNDPWDDHYHGTHVAGIIGANGTVKGVAPGSKQLGLKVLSASGYGSDSDIIAAMEFATDPDRNPLTDDAADASSMSLGGWDPNPDGIGPIAADTSTRLGTLTVIAAGNSGATSSVGSPGVSREAITVGSTTKADLLSGFSSRGPTLGFDMKPDLVAPGSSIVSTANGGTGGYYTLSGTSMATPHVSGAVALLKQAHPDLSVAEVKSALVNTAKDLGLGVFQQGGGRLDTLTMVQATVSVEPHKLAMGRLSRAALATNATLVLENRGNASVTLNLTARDVFGMYPDMTYVNNNTDLNFVTVAPASLTLNAGARQAVTVAFAPSPSAAPGHYWGSINASNGTSWVTVPFAYYVRATLLLVDDDSSDRWSGVAPFDNFAGFPSASNNLSWSLDRLAVKHDIFTAVHYTDNGPDLIDLVNYPVVVWATGYDYDYSDGYHTHRSLSTRDTRVLAAYLDQGGQLWLVGENIAWELFGHTNSTVGAAHFLNAYLGVSRVENELNTPNPLNGSAGTFMGGASYATATDWADYGNDGDFATNLTPSPRGFTVLNGTTTDVYGKAFANASLAVAVNNSTYRSVYWGTEFSWLSTNASFDDAVSRTLGFFNVSKVLSLPANDLALDVVVDPYKSDWLPIFEADWARPFDDLAHVGVPFNATLWVTNLGSSVQRDVFVNVSFRDNTTAPLRTVELFFAEIPPTSIVHASAQFTPTKHGYFTVNAAMNRTDANASNSADASRVLVPNFEDEVGTPGAWSLAGDWRTASPWSYTAPSSFRVGLKNSANDTLTSPVLNFSRVNASATAGGVRLYFWMSGSVGGGDAVYIEAKNSSSSAWTLERTLNSLSAPSSWNYFLQGVALPELAGTTGQFRFRFVTGASSTSTFHADHMMIWTFHELGTGLSPSASVLNATRDEGQLLDFRGSHANPNNATAIAYLWEFGDGATASTRNATHAYGDEGSYVVRFTVNDGAGLNETATFTTDVLNVAPTVSSSGSAPEPSLEGGSVNFTALCADAGFLDALSYSWNYGDGTSNATGANTSHTFGNQGNFTVTVVCSDGDGGVATSVFTQRVSNVAPSVDSALSGANPSDEGASVQFTGSCSDPGTSDAVSYLWVFSDGSPNATGSSVSHTFADEGNFTVSLRCSDGEGGLGQSDLTQSVRNVAPSVATAAATGSLAEGQTVNFTALCTDPGTQDSLSYSWSFGDLSGPASGASTSHVYLDDGTYTVSLTCNDGDGGSAVTNINVVIANGAPSVQITGLNLTDEGTLVALGSTVSDPGVLDTFTFSWDFADGSAGAFTPNTTHRFADNGVYAVLLSVRDNGGAVSQATLVVVVRNVAPSVTAEAAGEFVEGAALGFSSLVTDPGTADTFTYVWLFGDGGVSSLGAPAHTFVDEGSYLVSLTVTDDDGGFSTANFTVAVGNAIPRLTLAPEDLAAVEGSDTRFFVTVLDAGVLDRLTVTLSFGDGTADVVYNASEATSALSHRFLNEGTFIVAVRVADGDDGFNQTAVAFTVLNVAPTLFVEASEYLVDENATVTLNATATDPGASDVLTISWQFSEDPAGASGASVTRRYAQDGTYLVNATVVDDAGASASVGVTIVVRNVAPTLEVTLPSELVEGLSLPYLALAVDAGPQDAVTVLWQWGDGASSNGEAADHRYADIGNYTLVVSATDDAGASVSRFFALTVGNLAPTIEAIGFEGSPAEGSALAFSASVSNEAGDALVFAWSFGDGTNASTEAAAHTFADSGTFTVRLTVGDGEGGVASLSRDITIDNVAPRLTCQVCPDSGVEGANLSVRAHATDPGRSDAVAYGLRLPDGTLLNSTDGSFDFRLTEPGTAALRLTARDSEGAETAFVFNVTVLPDFDGDGLEDAVDQDDDNDGAPDATDPAPLDPSIVSPTVTEPPQSGLPLLLLLALLAVAGGAIAFAAARRRRRGP